MSPQTVAFVSQIMSLIVLPIVGTIVAIRVSHTKASAEAKAKKAMDTAHKTQQEQDAIRVGVQALLRNEILDKYENYMRQGYIDIYGRDNLDRMYTQYKALGGNSTITLVMEELKALDTIDPREIKKD